ncbi:hypothetical protein [uncultured Serinicoccus sp.]|uniref:hypothetical protein n=1 Tax=uncultured Serinicoccus sp. TaxID=735514 RepID=UPI00260A786C|nr:hypothetical protein [uncultured Serinicoccus sp.]
MFEHDDDGIRDLLRRGAVGAPVDDLTFAAWARGRSRSRTRVWSMAGAGAAASAAALATVWSLGGGETIRPIPADDASNTSAPAAARQDYRVVFDVVDGQPGTNGPVSGWDQLAGLELEPVAFTVDTSHGTSSAANRGLLGLGGRVSVTADHSFVVTDGCSVETYPGLDVTAGALRPGATLPMRSDDPDCDPAPPLQPRDVLLILPTMGSTSDGAPAATAPGLAWVEGQLVVTGQVDEDFIIPTTSLPQESGPTILHFASVPQHQVEDDVLLDPPSGSVPDTANPLEGTWYLLDQRGVAPETTGGPSLTFDGDTWTVALCRHELRATGDLADGTINITGPWAVVDQAATTDTPGEPTEQNCPNLPWQQPAAWQNLLDNEPQILLEPDSEEQPATMTIESGISNP